MTFIKITAKPHFVEKVHITDHDSKMRAEGYMLMRETIQIRKGTEFKITILDPQMDTVEAKYRKVYAALREVSYTMGELGMLAPMPTRVPSYLREKDSRRYVDEEVDFSDSEEFAFFYIHSGIKGWYVAQESKAGEVTIAIDERFPKYFSRESEISFLKSEEKMSDLACYAQDYYAQIIGLGPDERYSL